jgi:hypothetical protein
MISLQIIGGLDIIKRNCSRNPIKQWPGIIADDSLYTRQQFILTKGKILLADNVDVVIYDAYKTCGCILLQL